MIKSPVVGDIVELSPDGLSSTNSMVFKLVFFCLWEYVDQRNDDGPGARVLTARADTVDFALVVVAVPRRAIAD